MKHGISRQRLDPVLAPDQFGVAGPLGLEDLDKCVTRHGIYPSFPAPTGVPWSEYIRLQRNRSRSVSSSTEVLDSGHARYITSRITQHARFMAAGTRSLPTDSPVPYFQPLERGHVSAGVHSDIGSPEGVPHGSVPIPPCHVSSDVFPYLSPSGIEYNPGVSEQDRLSTYTGLNDYDTLFEARHGRGAIDSVPKLDHGVLVASTVVMPITTSGVCMPENIRTGARPKHTPYCGLPPPIQRGLVPVGEIPSTAGHKIVSPISTGCILGEGSAIFTDMTETLLTTLDQQMAISDEAWKPEGSLSGNHVIAGPVASHGNIKDSKIKPLPVTKVDSRYPDLYLPVKENYKISNKFYGYMDKMSTDGNPMTLVELTELSYRYRTIIYAVDRVNGTMYSKFSVGYRVIDERATLEPQYEDASLEGMYVPMHLVPISTVPRMTQTITPLAKSTPITQSSQMPAISDILPPVRDILEPASNEQVRSAYLKRQMRQMDSIKLPSGMPSLEDGIVPRPESLQDRKQSFCQENKVTEAGMGIT